MFDNLKNKLRWNEILNNPTTPSYMASVIKEIMLPYGISAHKYQINKECIDNVCKYSRNGDSATPSVIATVSDLNYKYSCIRHSSMPLWYYYAFPDVFLWTISDEGTTYFKRVIEPFLNGKNIIDGRGYVDKEFVAYFIRQYLLATGKKLECRI